jgi:threonine synthase
MSELSQGPQGHNPSGLILCTNCRRPYPDQGTPYRCPVCGGVFDFTSLPTFDPAQIDESQPGLWRYRHALGLSATAPQVTIGEGNTPLVWRTVMGRQVAFKLEFLNPSGSYKDRGSALLVSFLRSRGVEQALEDSSGNAGASFAAYAAAAGIHARVFVPQSASGPKRTQIEAYGAEVISVAGPRSNAAEAVQRAAEEGIAYASHAYLPHGLGGYATLAYELQEQMKQQAGQTPGAVITPAGQGNLLLATARGFTSLKKSGLLERVPVMVGVQALACAPLWALYRYGASGLGWVAEGETLAEGVRVRFPVRGDAVMRMLAGEAGISDPSYRPAGLLVAVDEPDILPGGQQLARLGFYVEPTSAIVWNALEQVIDQLPDPIVVVLTGSGLKTT